MRTVDLLALDDFGAQSGTPWAREKRCQPVNYRVRPDAQRPAHGGNDLRLAGWVKHGEHKGQIRCHITGQQRNAKFN